MIEIDGKIVSLDVLQQHFLCDVGKCRGMCCVEGNSGAPLEKEELALLEKEFEAFHPYMKSEGIKAVREQGVYIVDEDGDLTTPLIDDAECAYSVCENGVTLCAIEKAWKDGRTTFRKPVSCHLYPIRVMKFSDGSCGLNYHRWSVCTPAVEWGKANKVPVYKALREPIIRRFGEEFYLALEQAEAFLEEEKGPGGQFF